MMFNYNKKDIAGFKIIGLLSAVILFIIILTFAIKNHFNKTIVEDWTRISAEKNVQIHNDCTNLYYGYQYRTSEFSLSLAKSKKLVSAFVNQNTRKTYEALYDFENVNDYNIEIYNSRLELFLFSGRQVYPDVTELIKALSGERFSVVKEIGMYSYIIVFEPVKNEKGATEGVIAVSKLLDINYDLQNKFFINAGIKKEIYDKFHIDVIFDFSRSPGAVLSYDTTSGELTQLSIYGINTDKIGKLVIPNLDQSSYILSVANKFDNIIGLLVFAFNILVLYGIILLSLRSESLILRSVIISAALIASRYLWLALDFPGKLITETGTDIFSPIHFASGVGYGIAKSIGELLITSIILLVITLYILINVIKYYRKELGYRKFRKKISKKRKEVIGIDDDALEEDFYEEPRHPWWLRLEFVLFALIVSIYSIHIYGLTVQSLIYNSTIKFIDKSDILSFNEPELIIVRLIITILSICLLLILVSCGLAVLKNIYQFVAYRKIVRKNSAISVFGVLIFINLLIALFPEQFDISLKLNLRLLILLIAGLFTLYIQRQLSFKRDYRLVNVVNFSFILLACVIFVPAVLLNKITAQENRYLERAAKEISQQSNDKISFLISTTLDDATDNPEVINGIDDKNKQNNLAFNIWAGSKLYDEDLNSAVYILDTAKKLISDFNINPGELISDSVIAFTIRNFDKKDLYDDETDTLIVQSEENQGEDTQGEMEEQGDKDANSEQNATNISNMLKAMLAGDVLQNKEMKFYASIRPIDKNSLITNVSEVQGIENIAGYVIVAAGYDAKNYLTQTRLGIFKNFTRDNILNKLTSTPVISEFSEGDLAGSSNKDISKSFVKSLDAFRESVKDKVDKSALRYDEFENEIYKSYYVSSEAGINGINTQKIYVVSVKVNDLGLTTFYFFRYLLFIVMIYLIVLVIYLLHKLILYLADRKNNRFFRFGFREKLFASFLLASVIPIVILAIYTRELVKDKNEEFYKNQLISDLRIVEQYIKSRTDVVVTPGKNIKNNSAPHINIFEKGFTESDKNFNFYEKTKLEATTSEQLYKSDLLDTRISGNAFYNIALLKRDYFPENLQIADYTFVAGYKPIYDKFNNLSGIISTQTVFKQSEINQELTETLIYILGPYFTAVIILIFIVNFLSYRISNPVLKLQKATEQLSKGNIDVQVKSNSKDEIGELVKSFNRMIKELKRSRAELKKAEREGAWRDIARQVAHEIKNPLTPMKLAMQHLYASYTHGSDDFKEILKTTNKMIIDQVETLNKIATEFGNFAKLPSRNYELLNINDILNDVVTLMDTKNNIHLKLDKNTKNGSVMGDKDEVRRALINIVKNSLQAIEEKETDGEGNVNIESVRNNGYIMVKIKDNGVGIDRHAKEKLFEPYFSTKSSGMGLGLVITKKILDDMKAKISVKSNMGEGTEVEIRFRIEEKQETQ